VEGWNDWFHSADQVKFTLFQRYGSSRRRRSPSREFLPGFILSPEYLFKWGIIRTPVSYRIERWMTAPQKTRDLINGVEPLVLESSGEEGMGMIKALLGLATWSPTSTWKSRADLKHVLHAVVETNVHVSRDNVRPLTAGALPAGLSTLINQHSANQEMIVEAALADDTDLAFQAFITTRRIIYRLIQPGNSSIGCFRQITNICLR